MNEKELQFKRGEEIKRNAMASLNLTPSERALFESQKIRAVPQSELNRMHWAGYSSPGLTQSSRNGVEVFVADKLPIVPNLTHEDYANLQPYITEKDVIPHEIGHARDRINTGKSSEDSAIRFEKRITVRGFEPIIPESASSGGRSVSALKDDFLDTLSFPGGPRFILPMSNAASQKDRNYRKTNTGKY